MGAEQPQDAGAWAANDLPAVVWERLREPVAGALTLLYGVQTERTEPAAQLERAVLTARELEALVRRTAADPDRHGRGAPPSRHSTTDLAHACRVALLAAVAAGWPTPERRLEAERIRAGLLAAEAPLRQYAQIHQREKAMERLGMLLRGQRP